MNGRSFSVPKLHKELRAKGALMVIADVETLDGPPVVEWLVHVGHGHIHKEVILVERDVQNTISSRQR